MYSKRLGPQGEVGDTVVFKWLFVSPTPSRGWDKVGTTEEVGTGRSTELLTETSFESAGLAIEGQIAIEPRGLSHSSINSL